MNNRTLLKYHSWFGLLAGLFLIIMGVSGSLLVFHQQIDDRIFEELVSKDYLEEPDMDAALRSVQERYPLWDTRLSQFKKGKVLVFDIRNIPQRRYLFVHPTSGDILKDLNANTHFTSWLLKLHYSLHMGAVGRVLVLLAGILFLLSLLSGIFLYRKSILKVLSFRLKLKKKKKSLHSTLHRYVGVWALLLNLVLVITGIVLAYSVAKAGINPPGPPQGPQVEVSISEALHELALALPDFTPTYIRFPLSSEGSITVYGKYDHDPFLYSEFYNTVSIDHRTGKTLAVQRIAEADAVTKMASTVLPLHYAEFGGMAMKVIYSFIGLSGPFLSVTGFFIWFRGSKRKKEKKKKKQRKISG